MTTNTFDSSEAFNIDLENTELFNSLISNVKDYAIFMLNTSGHITSWNLGIEYITGYTSEEIIGKHFSVFYTTEQIEKGEPEFNLESAREEGRFENENWRVRKDGSKFWADVIFTAIYDDQRSLKGYSKITRDITKRKELEIQMKKSNEELEDGVRLKTADLTNERILMKALMDNLENSPLGFIQWDDKIQPRLWSKRAEEIFGWTKEEATSEQIKWFTKVYEADLPWVSVIAAELLAGRIQKNQVQHRNYTRDGRVIWCEWFNSVQRDDNGKVLSILSLIQDVTDKKKSELELRSSENKYRLLFEESPLPMVMLEYPSRNIIAVNNATVQKFGYTKAEFENMTILDLRRMDEIYKSEEFYQELSEKKHLKDKAWLVSKDKEELLFEVEIFEIMLEGKLIYQASMIDITQETLAKEELLKRNAQLRELASHLQNIREEERTSMAREIHDELGQQLTGLKMDISWLNRKLVTDDKNIRNKLITSLELIDGTIDTVRKIAASLRPSVLDDLGLAEAIDWQGREFALRTGIAVEFICTVEGDKFPPDITIGIFRIFQESLTNIARHAHATLVTSELKNPGSSLVLRISDNGVGFDIKQKKKEKTLGLLGMKERITMLNGKYEIISEPGKGTLISVEIPLLVLTPQLS